MNNDEPNESPNPGSEFTSDPRSESAAPPSGEATPDAYGLGPEAFAAPLAATEEVLTPAPPPRIGRPLLAWFVTICIVSVVVGMNTFTDPEEALVEGQDENAFQHLVWEFQGKLAVGMADLMGPASDDQLINGIRAEFKSTYEGRLRLAVLSGELEDPEAATEQLANLQKDVDDEDFDPSESQLQTSATLTRLYADYAEDAWAAPGVDAAQRDLLEEQLGWYGHLALAPKAAPDDSEHQALMIEARFMVVALFAAMFFMLMIGFGGLGGCVLFVALMLSGKLKRRLIAGAPHGGVYAETFALWMALFLLFTIGAGALSEVIDFGEARFIPTLVAMFASLIALAWPVLRGVPWRQVRRDIGWRSEQNFLIEMLAGAAGWVSTLPLVVVGVMMMLFLALMQELIFGGGGAAGGQQGPSHPIVEWLADSDWRGRLQLFVMACIAAPIVEETMFRGVLYRQLRDATVRWRVGASIVTAALLNSFVFAVIHPQGWLAVPALMSLAIGFSLLREWRGSLLASMTAHGINNAMATSVFFIFF